MLLDTPRVSSRLDLLYIVTREFNTGLDIDEALHNVLTATLASVGASDASLFLVKPNGTVGQATIISGFKKETYPQATLDAVFEGGLINWVWREKSGAVIQDTTTDSRWYKEALTPEIGNAASVVAVPILQRPDNLVGVITITSAQPNYFDDSDLAMLTIIADQAAFALTNARLFEAELQRRRVADTLSSIAQTINSTLDLNHALTLILEQLALVVDYDSSCILLYEDISHALMVRAARGLPEGKHTLNVDLPLEDNVLLHRAITQRETFIIGDVDANPKWQACFISPQVKSWIGIPLIAKDKVVGVLSVDSYTKNRYSSDNNVDIVAAFADQAATAVANAQIVAQLQDAENRYSALFEDSTDMIIITDYEGVIHKINRRACQMLRRPKDAMLGLNIAFIAPSLTGFLAEQTHLLQAWREASIEIEIKNAYRETIALDIKVRNIQFEGQDRVEWVGRDISARKEIEKMRQDLVHMLVHDLRGPLGNMINTFDLISMVVDMNADTAKIKQFSEVGKRTGRTLTDLVDSMLDVGRLEQGDVPLQRGPTNLASLLGDVQEQTGPQASAKDTTLIVHPPPDHVEEAWLDNSLVRRLLVNLVGNAIKYAPEEAEVSLTTSIDNGKLHFAIKDNGPGIGKSDQEHIFNKFSRVNYSSSGPSGVGLGLAFCKLATEAHNGTIYVESEGIPGQGSIFHVLLPLIEPDEA